VLKVVVELEELETELAEETLEVVVELPAPEAEEVEAEVVEVEDSREEDAELLGDQPQG
jgi:hypothetical protein